MKRLIVIQLLKLIVNESIQKNEESTSGIPEKKPNNTQIFHTFLTSAKVDIFVGNEQEFPKKFIKINYAFSQGAENVSKK